MAIVTMKNATLTIDGTEFSPEISDANVGATSTDLTFTAINGEVLSEVGAPAYVLNLTFAQDLEGTSLMAELFTRHGEKAAVVISPNGTGEGSISGTVVLKVPSVIGGAAGAYATSTVALPFDGSPTIVFATAGA